MAKRTTNSATMVEITTNNIVAWDSLKQSDGPIFIHEYTESRVLGTIMHAIKSSLYVGNFALHFLDHSLFR